MRRVRTKHLWLRHAALIAATLSMAAHAELLPQEQRTQLISQFAGNIGMVALGTHIHLLESDTEVALLLGYAPASAVGRDSFTLAAKFNFIADAPRHGKYYSLEPYYGFDIAYYFGDATRIAGYPSDYYTYPASAWHILPHLGVKIAETRYRLPRMTFYSEISTVDAYLVSYFNNRSTLPFSDILSLSFGIMLPLP